MQTCRLTYWQPPSADQHQRGRAWQNVCVQCIFLLLQLSVALENHEALQCCALSWQAETNLRFSQNLRSNEGSNSEEVYYGTQPALSCSFQF